ncbi:hypothetical protein OUZ56_030249 [Daphnia magna]|uniref:Uncharacterized protein n=1 Tax=Daphnia magna TaxID=35525 RepID=A0ABQ9ZQT2_9CRUS|nr:hypothetical protein OUZ56_030249 [Daphnia magna]
MFSLNTKKKIHIFVILVKFGVDSMVQADPTSNDNFSYKCLAPRLAASSGYSRFLNLIFESSFCLRRKN